MTQEALLSIWRSGARFDRARGSVRAWTLGIVRNRAIDLLRKESGRSPKLASGGEEMLERRAAEELTDTEAVRRETAREVRGAIKELPDDQSRVIQLAYFGGFSHSEIAEMLNEPLGHDQGPDAPRHGQDQGDPGGGLVNGEHPDRDDLVAFALGALEPGEERARRGPRAELRALHARAARRWSRRSPCSASRSSSSSRRRSCASACSPTSASEAGRRAPSRTTRPRPARAAWPARIPAAARGRARDRRRDRGAASAATWSRDDAAEAEARPTVAVMPATPGIGGRSRSARHSSMLELHGHGRS